MEASQDETARLAPPSSDVARLEEGHEEEPLGCVSGADLRDSLGSRSAIAKPKRACVAAGVLSMVLVATTLLTRSSRPTPMARPQANDLIISGKAEDPCRGCAEKLKADKNGVVAHPERFSEALTFEDVQNVKHSLQASCPQKCVAEKIKTDEDELMEDVDDTDLAEMKRREKCRRRRRRRRRLTDTDCHTAERGEKCHQMVVFTMEKGLDMYDDLSKKSSFEDVQQVLHEERPRDCPKPCAAAKADHVVGQVLGSLGIGKEEDLEGVGLDGEDDDTEEEDCDDEDTVQALVDDVDHPPADCHTSEPSEDCYKQVLYIQTQGLRDHPKWFRGLNSASSFEQIQAFLHKGGNKSAGHCPAPCAETCHDALEGEPCRNSVDWALKEGIKKNPEWYEGVTVDSSFKEVQYAIHNDDNAEVYCPQPCGFCHTAKDGERCYSAVDWVLKEGLDKQPASYRGLNKFSSFEEVQDHLHKNKSEAAAKCPKPCPPAAPDFAVP